MRILVFSELFYPHGGGAELATRLYAKMLSESGDANLTIVTRQFPGEPQTERINKNLVIHRVPFSTVGGRYDSLVNVGRMFSNAIIKRLRESDVVYVPGGWYSVIPLAKAYKKPVVVHLHNYFMVCPTSLMYDFASNAIKPSSLKGFLIHERVEKRRQTSKLVLSGFLNEIMGGFYKRISLISDAFIFVSRRQMELTLSFLPWIRTKSRVIYNPIPVLPFIAAKEKGIAYFGGKSFVKGFHIFMKVVKLLSKRCANSERLEVFMTGVSNEKILLNIGSAHLHFLPWVGRRDIEKIMERVAVVVIPSLIPEPSPYTFVESVLYGKTVVASSLGGMQEIIGGSCQNGVKFVDPVNHETIEDDISSFLAMELEELNKIGADNRKYILERFNNEKITNDFLGVLCNIVR